MESITFDVGYTDSDIMREMRRDKRRVLKMEYKGVRTDYPYKLVWYVQE